MVKRIGMASEHEFFQRRNEQLVRALREKMAHSEAVTGLREVAGVEDDTLLATLATMGIDRDTLPILHLAPLLEVAWADGEIQPDERKLLEEAAAEAGVKDGSPAHERLEALLSARPDQAFFDSALAYIASLLAALPAEEAGAARDNVSQLALSVAKANGGLFGVGAVDTDERSALRRIAAKLDRSQQ